MSPSTGNTPQNPQTKWQHTPPRPVIIWLLISLPLVIWDCAYVLLRPHSLPPNGALHKRFFSPYALYGSVDHLYSRQAYEDHIGFTGAQAALNVLETLLHAAYLWWGVKGRTRAENDDDGGALGLLLGVVAAAMTFSKTLLYWLNEWFSGFANIKHNSWTRLVLFWILPGGSWIVFPLYMLWVLGKDVIRGLELAAGVPTTTTTAGGTRSGRKKVE